MSAPTAIAMQPNERPPDLLEPAGAAERGDAGSPSGVPPRVSTFRFRTRRRLVVVFSVVIAAFVSTLAVQLLVLRRMEASIARMEQHEAETRLAMQAESAARARDGRRDEVPGGSRDAHLGALQEATSRSRRELLELQRAALRWTATLLLVAPILGALAVVYLSRSVARPLARFSDGAAALAGGDLDTRIEVGTRDEFGALAAELNSMALALKEHQRRLVESERAAGIGRVVAVVADEINNPLQVMLGYLSLNRDHADRRLAGQLALVEEETLRCKRVVEGLVELTRAAKLGVAPVDVRERCEEPPDELGFPGGPARSGSR